MEIENKKQKLRILNIKKQNQLYTNEEENKDNEEHKKTNSDSKRSKTVAKTNKKKTTMMRDSFRNSIGVKKGPVITEEEVLKDIIPRIMANYKGEEYYDKEEEQNIKKKNNKVEVTLPSIPAKYSNKVSFAL